jgi:rod shape-determining protein MreC
MMLTGFAHFLLSAIVAAWLLRLALPLLRSYGQRVVFIAGLGVFAAIALQPSGPIWMFHPWDRVLSDMAYTIRKIDSFKGENERLQAENRNLNFRLQQMNEIQRENDQLRKQLKFEQETCAAGVCMDFHPGRIIGRSPDSNGNFILTDLGTEDGAHAGSAIAVSGGMMIGKVMEVSGGYSKVMLLTASDSSVNCLTQATRANGLLRGKYSTGVKLEMIDQSEQLNPGDVVITSGLETGIPKGLLLGKISSVEQSPNTVFKSADIELFADLGHVEEVYLVR